MSVAERLEAVRRCAEHVATAKAELDSAIHSARDEGASLRAIALAAGLSYETIRKMLEG